MDMRSFILAARFAPLFLSQQRMSAQSAPCGWQISHTLQLLSAWHAAQQLSTVAFVKLRISPPL
jgi:hypothetical protein